MDIRDEINENLDLLGITEGQLAAENRREIQRLIHEPVSAEVPEQPRRPYGTRDNRTWREDR